MSVIDVTGAVAFDQATASGSVLVKLGADHRCPPCRGVAAILPKLEGDLGIKVVAVNVDAAENSFVIERFGRKGVPRFFFYHEGQIRGETLGFGDYQPLRAWLEASMRVSALTVPEASDAEQEFAEEAAALWQAYLAAAAKEEPRWTALQSRVQIAYTRAQQANESSLISREIDQQEYDTAMARATEQAKEDAAPMLAAYALIYARYVEGLTTICAPFSTSTQTAAEVSGAACDLRDPACRA
jgi:thioredoxin-like negative regulator of GroEL